MAPQDTPSRKLDQYIVRFPDGMRDQLKAVAEQNGRSMNSEIISRLEESFDPPKQSPGTTLAIQLAVSLAHQIDRLMGVRPTSRDGANWVLSKALAGQSNWDEVENFVAGMPHRIKDAGLAPPPQSIDEYGEVRTIPPGETQSGIDLANEAIQEAITKSVREAVSDALEPWAEMQREALLELFVQASSKAPTDAGFYAESVKRIKAMRNRAAGKQADEEPTKAQLAHPKPERSQSSRVANDDAGLSRMAEEIRALRTSKEEPAAAPAAPADDNETKSDGKAARNKK